MLKNPFHMALENKCDVNVKGDVLFEEEIKQKIVN